MIRIKGMFVRIVLGVLVGFVTYSICFPSMVGAKVPTVEEAIEILEAASASLSHHGPWETMPVPPYHASYNELFGSVSLAGAFYDYYEEIEEAVFPIYHHDMHQMSLWFQAGSAVLLEALLSTDYPRFTHNGYPAFGGNIETDEIYRQYMGIFVAIDGYYVFVYRESRPIGESDPDAFPILDAVWQQLKAGFRIIRRCDKGYNHCN